MSPPLARVAARRRCDARSVGSIATADQRSAIAATRFPAWIIIAAPSLSASRSLRLGPLCGAPGSSSARGSFAPGFARRESSIAGSVDPVNKTSDPHLGEDPPPPAWLGPQRGACFALDLRGQPARAGGDRLERARDVDPPRRREVRGELLLIQHDRLPGRSEKHVDDEVGVADHILPDDRVARDIAVISDGPRSIQPVIDVVWAVAPVMRDRDLTRMKHDAGVG